MPQQRYTVVGVYRCPLGQRFGTTVQADSPEEAELAAHREADEGLMVAGVFEGEVDSLDMYTDGCSFGVPGDS